MKLEDQAKVREYRDVLLERFQKYFYFKITPEQEGELRDYMQELRDIPQKQFVEGVEMKDIKFPTVPSWVSTL
jgi:hypothetical protein